MTKTEGPTIELTLTLDEAKHIAPALRHWATKVCERKFACSSDPFGELHDAARTYAALMVVFKKLSGFCGRNNVELLGSDGRVAYR